MNRRSWIGSSLLLVGVLIVGGALAGWKRAALAAEEAQSANQPEPAETVTVAAAQPREHRRTTTSIGTVLALQSITLRNEVPGTVERVALEPGQIVEPGTLLVALDVSVEEAELRAQQAQAALAQTLLERVQLMSKSDVASDTELDRATAERDVALAQVARTQAVIARKTIRAPFRARVGMADVHVGQYLEEGTRLTTLQGVDDAAHVDFTVAQAVAATLRAGDPVEVFAPGSPQSIPAQIVAVDARVDPTTRNASVRARVDAASPAPGASVRVRVPVGPADKAVVVPVSALRKGPEGDHVFVVAPGADGKPRAQRRTVRAGTVLGDEVLIYAGVQPGEAVAASGSFKLREAALVVVAEDTNVASTKVARN